MAITGTGTQADPWIINDAADLVSFAGNTSYWAANTYAELGSDIDMDGVTWSTAIGKTNNVYYNGTFDGKNHIISNFDHSVDPLFYRINNSVSNIVFDHSTCTNNNGYGNAVLTSYLGRHDNAAGHVDNCHIRNATMTITGSSYEFGFICAFSGSETNSRSTISNCSVENSSASCSGKFSCICASPHRINISNCSVVSCELTGAKERYNPAVTAFGCDCEDVTIDNCKCVDVTVTNDGQWGNTALFCNSCGESVVISNCKIIGCNIVLDSTTTGSFVFASTSSSQLTTFPAITNTHVTSCRSTGSRGAFGFTYSMRGTYTRCGVRDTYLEATTIAGGMFGYSDEFSTGSVSDCYVDGCTVRTTNDTSVSYSHGAGGFIGGATNNTYTNCYVYDTDVDFVTNGGGFCGYTESGTTMTDCCCYGGNRGTIFCRSGATLINCKSENDISESEIHSQPWWADTMHFNFTTPWVWNKPVSLPRFTVGTVVAVYTKTLGEWGVLPISIEMSKVTGLSNALAGKQKLITVSISEPTSAEGTDGDIWLVYTA